MEEKETEAKRAGVYYPAAGLISISAAFLIGISSTGWDVHSGAVFLWIAALPALGVIVPFVLFVKSLNVVRQSLAQQESSVKTYSMVLTGLLGVVLTGLLLFLLWTTLK